MEPGKASRGPTASNGEGLLSLALGRRFRGKEVRWYYSPVTYPSDGVRVGKPNGDLLLKTSAHYEEQVATL